jgi:hypothetical protein
MDTTQTITTGVTWNKKTKGIILTGLLVAVPLIWSGPQLLVGTVINLLLCLSAMSSERNWQLRAAVPSLMVILHGVLFGAFTPYLFYLWPIITVGNLVYMGVWQNKMNIPVVVKVFLAAFLKMIITFSGAAILFKLSIVPTALLNSMGLIQMVTAIIGGSIATIWMTKNRKILLKADNRWWQCWHRHFR